MKRTQPGFTLIELLIVVAIIAILAAIAVPNFLEAQVRTKVTVSYAEMRSQRTAMEAYRVDHNAYPESWNEPRWPRLTELTTPVAYLTVCPYDPFSPKSGRPLYYHYVSGTDEYGPLLANLGGLLLTGCQYPHAQLYPVAHSGQRPQHVH